MKLFHLITLLVVVWLLPSTVVACDDGITLSIAEDRALGYISADRYSVTEADEAYYCETGCCMTGCCCGPLPLFATHFPHPNTFPERVLVYQPKLLSVHRILPFRPPIT